MQIFIYLQSTCIQMWCNKREKTHAASCEIVNKFNFNLSLCSWASFLYVICRMFHFTCLNLNRVHLIKSAFKIIIALLLQRLKNIPVSAAVAVNPKAQTFRVELNRSAIAANLLYLFSVSSGCSHDELVSGNYDNSNDNNNINRNNKYDFDFDSIAVRKV